MTDSLTPHLPGRVAAVLFDMDNTLVASEDAWFEAARQLWDEAGGDSTGKGILGGTVDDVVNEFLLDFPDTDAEELSRRLVERLAGALAETGLSFGLTKIGPFAETDGFVAANTDAVRAAVAELPDARVLFVTHSIPTAMDAASGPGPRSAQPGSRMAAPGEANT